MRRLVLMVGTRPAERRREEGEAGVLVHFHSLMPVSGDFFFFSCTELWSALELTSIIIWYFAFCVHGGENTTPC